MNPATLAEILRANRPDPMEATVGERRRWLALVGDTAAWFQTNRQHFDRDHYLAECGVEGA